MDIEKDLDKTLQGVIEKYLHADDTSDHHLQDRLDSHEIMAVDIRLALRSAYLLGFQAAGGFFTKEHT